MKIGIGINSHKNFKDLVDREKFCIESLLTCKKKNSNITLYNIISDKDNIEFENFKTLKISQDKKFPYVNKLIDALANTDNDIIIFLNNDIILNNTFFKQLDKDIETYPTSRAHLHHLTSLSDPLSIQSYSVMGFDLFAFKTKWWVKNRDLFPDMYLGRPYWDTVYFMKCVLNSKYKIINKLPPTIFHIEHQSTSVKNNDEYQRFNELVAAQTPEMNKWWYYVHNILLKRPTVDNILWWQPHDNEIDIEKDFFKNEN